MKPPRIAPLHPGSAEGCARVAAVLVAGYARSAIQARGTFRIALPGGRSPRAMLAKLIAHREEGIPWGLDWTKVTVFFVDERAVPPDDPESNFHMVQEALVAPLGAEAPQIVRMSGEAADLEAAAREYERELLAPLDLAVVGLGERERRVAVVLDSPKPPARRLTLTPRALGEARHVLGLALGADKAEAFRRLFDPAEQPGPPARLAGDAVWIADPEADRLRSSADQGAEPERPAD